LDLKDLIINIFYIDSGKNYGNMNNKSEIFKLIDTFSIYSNTISQTDLEYKNIFKNIEFLDFFKKKMKWKHIIY
jgi:hypothetical protein